MPRELERGLVQRHVNRVQNMGGESWRMRAIVICNVLLMKQRDEK